MNYQLESRMREIRQSGSEGGGTNNRFSLPLLNPSGKPSGDGYKAERIDRFFKLPQHLVSRFALFEAENDS